MSNFFVEAFNRHAKQVEGKALVKFLGIFDQDEPILFWIKVEEENWFRFFVDGIMLRWFSFEHIDRDDVKQEGTEKVINLTNKHELTDVVISTMTFDQKEIEGVRYGELVIEFENGMSFTIKDFQDEETKAVFEIEDKKSE